MISPHLSAFLDFLNSLECAWVAFTYAPVRSAFSYKNGKPDQQWLEQVRKSLGREPGAEPEPQCCQRLTVSVSDAGPHLHLCIRTVPGRLLLLHASCSC